jgi:hypothetical protein
MCVLVLFAPVESPLLEAASAALGALVASCATHHGLRAPSAGRAISRTIGAIVLTGGVIGWVLATTAVVMARRPDRLSAGAVGETIVLWLVAIALGMGLGFFLSIPLAALTGAVKRATEPGTWEADERGKRVAAVLLGLSGLLGCLLDVCFVREAWVFVVTVVCAGIGFSTLAVVESRLHAFAHWRASVRGGQIRGLRVRPRAPDDAGLDLPTVGDAGEILEWCGATEGAYRGAHATPVARI